MALGKIQVNNVNQYQSTPDEVERRFVFIGTTAVKHLQGVVTALNAGSDLDAVFTSEDKKTTDFECTAYRFLSAAQIEAGQGWSAAFVGLGGDVATWQDALAQAMKLNQFEAVVLCDPMTKVEELKAVQIEMDSVQSKLAQYMFAITCAPEIDAGEESGQTWAEYVTAQKKLVENLVAERVMCVPILFGNDPGVLAGRLCDRTVTIADSPMRTATGTLTALGSSGLDKSGAAMPDTLFEQLDALKFSVPQTYPGERGYYWADGNTFDLDTGDFKVIENLRVVLKACRWVYKAAIPSIGDRSLNSSNTEKFESVFRKPLMLMSKASVVGGESFPGEIYPPGPNAVSINWTEREKVVIWVSVRPYNAPKEITVGVGLDLSEEE